MRSVLIAVLGGVLAVARVGLAAPPGMSQHFDCSDGGTTSCAIDDTGCVSNTAAHLKCSSKIGKSFAKAVGSVIKCHIKQAQQRFQGASITGAGTSEENCEENPGNSAKGKLDATLTKLAASGLCDPAQLSNAALEESVLFDPGPASLDAQNDDVFCDTTSGAFIGDDDAGSVPNDANGLKCAVTVDKMVIRLVASVIKCHDKMNKAFFKGVDVDEELCEETDPVSHRGAFDKYNQQRDKLALLNICPGCLDSAGIDAIGANALSQLETANQLAYPCNLGP
jgi:hypothetical protein